MLKAILSISGKPGLYKLVSQAKNMLIVESVVTGKRTPAYAHDKVISLGDIAIFTESGEVPLREVLIKVKEKENGAVSSIDLKSNPDVLRKYFAEILPDFDRERVYPTDIKKLLSWYNLLVEKDLVDFSEEKETSHFMKKLADDLSKEIKQLEKKPVDKLLDDRYEKYRKIGRYSEYSEAVGEVPGAAQLLGASKAPARKRRGLFGRG